MGRVPAKDKTFRAIRRHEYVIMKPNIIRLSQRYATALRAHVQSESGAGLKPALELGRQAAALGLKPLELARIHEQAIATLKLSQRKDGMVRRAKTFFTEALTPIVATQDATHQSQKDLQQLNETLNRRTRELATTNRRLQLGIRQRKRVENTLQQTGKRSARLLKNSLQLQKGLRQLTHQRLVAQEAERKQVSSELQDDIAQTLMGINVRLLTMKRGAHGNTTGLKKEIAGTRRLVVKTTRSLKRTAHKFSHP
jgi:signal transduction histidine kinase